MRSYQIARLDILPTDLSDWQDAAWQSVEILAVDSFRPESSDHRPLTRARFGFSGSTLYGIFQVQDRYVRCVQTQFQAHTHLDSCVEVFLQPRPEQGYFNFEFNCSGVLAVFYITDPTRTPNLFQAFEYLTRQDVQGVKVDTSLQGVIDPEISEPLTWTLGFAIPAAVMERYIGPLGGLAGQTWRANVYKCGDETSHPHWAAWSPVAELNFHQPQDFGVFLFAQNNA